MCHEESPTVPPMAIKNPSSCWGREQEGSGDRQQRKEDDRLRDKAFALEG